MKKGMTLGIATLLAIGSFSPATFASDLNNEPINVLAADKKKDKEKEDEKIVERVLVEKLTLEDAIKYGLDSSYSLMTLDYGIKSLKVSEDKIEDQFDVAESELEFLISERERLKKETSGDTATVDTATVDLETELSSLIGNLNNAGIVVEAPGAPASSDTDILKGQMNYLREFLGNVHGSLEATRIANEKAQDKEKLKEIEAKLPGLRSQVIALEKTLDDFDIQQTEAFNNRIQVRQEIKFNIISSYVGLIMAQQQIEFMKETLQTQQAEAASVKKRYELGLLSQKEYEKSTRDIKNLEEDIVISERDLKNNKAAFALNIGIAYNEDYTIEEPKLGEMAPIKQEKTTEELVKNSYNMVNARTQLRIKEDALDDVEDMDGRVKEDEELAEIEVEIAKINYEQAQVNLENSIVSLFAQLDTKYKELKDAEEELEVAIADVEDLQLYFDLGLTSKHDYESSTVSVKQAELAYNNAKYQYYLLQQKVEALNEGIIIN